MIVVDVCLLRAQTTLHACLVTAMTDDRNDSCLYAGTHSGHRWHFKRVI